MPISVPGVHYLGGYTKRHSTVYARSQVRYPAPAKFFFIFFRWEIMANTKYGHGKVGTMIHASPIADFFHVLLVLYAKI